LYDNANIDIELLALEQSVFHYHQTTSRKFHHSTYWPQITPYLSQRKANMNRFRI